MNQLNKISLRAKYTQHNQALHLIAIPLCSIAAGELYRYGGAADKAAILWGESPLPSIARFRRLVYPMHGKVTTRGLLGRKSHGCPVCVAQR